MRNSQRMMHNRNLRLVAIGRRMNLPACRCGMRMSLGFLPWMEPEFLLPCPWLRRQRVERGLSVAGRGERR